MNNLQPLKWVQSNGMGVITHTAESPLHSYIIRYDELERAYLIDYFERMTGEHGSEFFKSVDEAKNWAQSTHYRDKMQPYVKPDSAKAYELTFDCDDSYFTVFMTLDKQAALDFIESVQVHDAGFYKWHGINDDANEAIVDRYNDTHPLKPYSSKIFESIYEDSFSEWARSYAGNSLVSQLSIIEHELFVKQGE